MKTRRDFLKSALITMGLGSMPLVANPLFATGLGKAVDVVKIMSFSCPVCRASEAQDHLIERAVRATGGRFVRGPIPSLMTESGEKEQVYYASRSISEELSETLVSLFYTAQQDLSIPLDNITQVYVYLQQHLDSVSDSQLESLFAAAQQSAAKAALSRAASLAYRMGVEDVPSYILVAGGSPSLALSPSSIGSSSLSSLRDEVISSINSLSQGK